MPKRRKKILVLGSTGSIGVNTLKVAARFPEQFEVVGLTAYNNLRLLKAQIERFRPKYAAVGSGKVAALRRAVSRVDIRDAETGLAELAGHPGVDIVVIGASGSCVLDAFLAAARAGKTIAPANKEALVIAGELIMREARRCNATVIPVDSEQSAIFQCLEGQDRLAVEKIHLTASGGALLNVPARRFSTLSVQDILRHPRWKMGRKITVDSATLMNKGFEVIEAMRLFGLTADQIDVVIHPEAIIHSMVAFRDGSVLAQLGVTDMRLPIQYALTWPKRLPAGLKSLDFAALGTLNFSRPDYARFPALKLCLQAAKAGGTLPAVLNAADEEAVAAFLSGTLKFTQIYETVAKVAARNRNVKNPSLDDIRRADTWARDEVRGLLKLGRVLN